MAKLKQEDIIFNFIKEECIKQEENNSIIGCTTNYIAEILNLKRPNVSSALNKLTRDGRIEKIDGRPVLYKVINEQGTKSEKDIFNEIIGKKSLEKSIKQAKAAVLYPPNGLHTLLLGPTGVGKTMFAELMYKFALEKEIIEKDGPFITFNCADYASNPQLILSQLFGYVKGAFTGANGDHKGMVEKAHGGILFLDEVHRLPPEGQELLFYLIDKGVISPLGSSEKKKIEVLIICATTENKDSSLLRTFTRRIPVTIDIPSLDERGIEDRFYLIEKFLKEESYRVNKKIVIKTEILKSILLYKCLGNIGQLRSDIKLICANAFLDTINNNRNNIEIEAIHLPNYIRKGGVYLKGKNEELKELLAGKEIFKFSNEILLKDKHTKNKAYKESFYENIENRIKELKSRNYSDEDIETIVNFEIDGYFKSYLNSLDDNIELSKIVGKKTIIYIEALLNTAKSELNRNFSNKVFYGLCLHFDASIKRLKANKKITNPNIIETIENYPKEFEITRNFMKMIEKELNVFIPLDEIAFIAMFLSSDLIEEKMKNDLPKVIIAMHGRSTASSMAEAVNTLLGINTVLAYDMDLNKKSELCYEELKNLISKNSSKAGVILMVDMGSLGIFGDLISEEVGIKIRVLDFVTTATALEVARNAEIERDIDKICDGVRGSVSVYLHGSRDVGVINTNKKNVILAICTTGEGSAIKIKKLIEDNISLEGTNTEVITSSVSDVNSVIKMINKISENKKIVAIVGGINPQVYGIPFISLSNLIMLNEYDTLRKIIEKESIHTDCKIIKDLFEIEEQIFNALRDKITGVDSLEYREYFDVFLGDVIKKLNYGINEEQLVSLIFHMLATTEALQQGKRSKKFKNLEQVLITYGNEIRVIKKALDVIEKQYKVEFKEDEICYILSILRKI